MSRVVSMRLQDDQAARLERYARTLGKSSGETSALLVEERLRECEFAFIEFRQSPLGRQAFMKGSRLGVWWVIRTARVAFGMDADRLAAHYERPAAWARAALSYYAAYPAEVDRAIDDYDAEAQELLQRALPDMQVVAIPFEPEG